VSDLEVLFFLFCWVTAIAEIWGGCPDLSWHCFGLGFYDAATWRGDQLRRDLEGHLDSSFWIGVVTALLFSLGSYLGLQSRT
jgi:hypothetical protein